MHNRVPPSIKMDFFLSLDSLVIKSFSLIPTVCWELTKKVFIKKKKGGHYYIPTVFKESSRVIHKQRY